MKDGAVLKNVGLVLEGGGMRGLYTAGVLEYFLEHYKMFPYVIGVSAGACMAASYLSRQAGRNREVNIDYVKHPNYLSFRNFVRHRQIFGMDFLFDEIPNNLVPFDYETFFKGTEQLVVGTTDCETGNPVYFKKEQYGEDLLTIIRASSSLPFIAPIVKYKDKKLLDGGMSDSIPIKKSELDGNEKNVVILTRNRGYVKKPSNSNWLIKRIYPNYPNLARILNERHRKYNETMDYLYDQEEKGNVFVISPSTPLNVKRIEKNTEKLTQLYQQGYQDAKTQFKSLENRLTS